MDVKCVRVLRPYEDKQNEDDTIFIDEEARYSLMKEWGEKVNIKGRRDIEGITIRPLAAIDQQGFIARANQALIDRLYVEFGEEVLLTRE